VNGSGSFQAVADVEPNCLQFFLRHVSLFPLRGAARAAAKGNIQVVVQISGSRAPALGRAMRATR
jgi:hypothetical protein